MSVSHSVDTKVPFARLLTLGFQHVLIMYVGSVSAPLVFGSAIGLDKATLGTLVCGSLLVAGIVTLIQSLGVGKVAGARLPIVCGSTGVAITPMILIANEYGLQAVYGSMIAGGVVGIALAWPFARLVRFFPPLVTGSVLTVVGISLIGVAGGMIIGRDPDSPSYADPKSAVLALVVLVLAVGFMFFGRGMWTQAGLLLAVLAGIAVAIIMGLFEFDGVKSAEWLGIPTPFHFGAPEFPITAVAAMSIVMAVIFAESTASLLALSEITGKPLSRADIARGLVGDGISGVLGGVFNASMDTVFNQNVGAVATTRVHSRYVTATGGVILILLGVVPKLGATVAAIPVPIVGGLAIILFGSIALIGIKTLFRADLDDPVNTTIAVVAIAVGLFSTVAEGILDRLPSMAQIILGSGIAVTAILALTLNLVFRHCPPVRDLVDGSRGAAGNDTASAVTAAS